MLDLTPDLNDNMYDDCRSKAAAVTDEATMQKWETHANFSQAEQNAKEPAHMYMKKRHSMAIYMYTNILLHPAKQNLEESTGKRQKETFESRSLYSSLSEAVQILRHSQVTCLRTIYRTETFLNPNVSKELIRFGTFVLGSDEWNFGRGASCFEVFTCFGADVTHYSTLKINSQVLIPPYEVFRVTETAAEAHRCKVLYRLESNLNCVYDPESNMLHPISAFPVDGFWLTFALACMIIVSLLLPFVIVKVFENHKKNAVYRASSFHNSTNSPASVVI